MSSSATAKTLATVRAASEAYKYGFVTDKIGRAHV